MKRLFFLFLLTTFVFSCELSDNLVPTDLSTSDPDPDTFDREAMLINWADNIIVPAYTAFAKKTADLKNAATAFVDDPSEMNYTDLVVKWESAYLLFQDVAMFDVGKAGIFRLTNQLNIYPTSLVFLDNNVLNGEYTLDLSSQDAVQGFPALDYLLFGIADGQNAIIDFYNTNENAEYYLNYLLVLAERIDGLTQAVLLDWNNGYRDQFVGNKGNSGTASVDKVINDFIFYYEKHLRAGKIGIPAGVFASTASGTKVEAYYRGDFSKLLFNRSLDAVQNFFNGVYYNGTEEGESMKTYLEYLAVNKNGRNLADVINEQFERSRTEAKGLLDDFADQVETNNLKMLSTYDKLQANVPNMKVDMVQAFNVSIDYQDADGD